MCKYCKTINLKENGSERSNECASITKIKDGIQEFNLYLNRYISEDDNIHNRELVLDYSVNVNSQSINIKEKIIKIKYCPFCGEEL